MDLVLRASATAEIGAGHVMRVAALAEAWHEGGFGQAILCGEVSLPFVQKRLEQLGIPIVDRWAALAPAVLVCDDYDPDVRAQAAESLSFTLRVLVDDLGGSVQTGYDAVWNPNAYGTRSLYPGFTGSVFTGTESIALRTGLPCWSGRISERVAVMLGGGRVDASLVAALRTVSRRLRTRRFVGLGSWVPAEWEVLPPEDPWPAIARASCLVTASGVSVWEAAFVGIPTAAVRLAPNQDRIFEWVTGCGAPGVDALGVMAGGGALAELLEQAVLAAQPLRPIENGAARIARALVGLATPSEAGV